MSERPSFFAPEHTADVRALHSHASLARARVGADRARAFDDAVRRIAVEGADGLVHRRIEADLVWGRPQHKKPSA